VNVASSWNTLVLDTFPYMDTVTPQHNVGPGMFLKSTLGGGTEYKVLHPHPDFSLSFSFHSHFQSQLLVSVLLVRVLSLNTIHHYRNKHHLSGGLWKSSNVTSQTQRAKTTICLCHTNTHTHTHTHTYSLSLSLKHREPHTHTLSLPHTHTHTHPPESWPPS
jgi:hypothetical protein